MVSGVMEIIVISAGGREPLVSQSGNPKDPASTCPAR